MTALRTIGLLLHRLRAERGMMLLVFILVAATAFGLAAAPRLLNRLADDGLRHEMASAMASQRNVQISTVDLPVAGQLGADLEAIERLGQTHEHRFPASLRGLISTRSFAVETVRFQISNSLRYPTFVSLRYQSGISDQVELVDGRLPESLGGRLPAAVLGFRTTDPPPEPERFEIAVARPIADALGLAVGDRLLGFADGDDPMVRFAFEVPIPIELELVGIFAPDDPAADYWNDDVGIQEVNLVGLGDSTIAFASVLISGDDYPGVASVGLPERVRWRYQLSTEGLSADNLNALVVDLRHLESMFRTSRSGLIQQGDVLLETGLLPIIERFESRRAASAAVLSVAGIGPLALALGATAMVAILVVSRRRAALVLTRGRGASGGLLLRLQAWEALLVGGPAAILGFALAGLVPGRASSASVLLAAVTLVGAVLLLVGATWPLARRTLGLIEREQPPTLRLAPRRLVLEVTAIVLAVAGAFLLRQRGLTISSAGNDEPARFDPFLGAVPVLIGLAVGLVAVRIYPMPVRALGWLAARRRDLVPVLGLRTVGRHPTIVALPLLVLMLTAAIGAFSSVVVATVDRGQLTASWQEFGADYVVESESGRAIGLPVDPTEVDGVSAVARAYRDPVARFDIGGPQTATILLFAVEPAAYREVTAGSPAQPDWPVAFEHPTAAEGLGTAGHPLPALISRRLPLGFRPLPLGAIFQATVQDRPLAFEVVGVRAEFPGIAPGTPFVIAPFDQLANAPLRDRLRTTVMLVRGPAAIEDALRVTVREQFVTSRLLSRHARYAEMHDAPLSAAIATGFRLSLAVAAAYTALTIVAAVTLTAGRRSRDLAYLRTLGVTRRQALGLIVVEHGPPVVFALAAGVALGLGVAWMIEPGLGLGSFIGPEATVTLQVDWLQIALVGAGLVAVVAIAVVGSTWLARRVEIGQVLRLADQ